jgi:para-aminobenzoate synthetase component 1
MNKLNKPEAQHIINEYYRLKIPFLFLIDFECKNNHVIPLSEIDSEEVLYEIQGHRNFEYDTLKKQSVSVKVDPIKFGDYEEAYNQIKSEINLGNTYLANLTFETPIQSKHTIKDIFYNSKAKYKLLLKDEFVVFSPETFIKIENNELSSFPMKGTIDASLVDAEKSLLSNKKEIAEHVTIVDLIRNDMSINTDNVSVEAFRYVDEIKTDNKSLLQVSSKITGKVKPRTQLGDLVFSLLPAGSISGAPKKKTLEILDRVENYNRGYYTGVFGIFDGEKLDSGVMIRFIENQKGKLVYKSGGGIHHLSDVHSEYQELIDKIYVPIS